jgi:chromosomal replication initiator protein
LRLGILTTLRERFEASQRAQKRRPIEFAPDVLPFLAERLATNGHELSGAFNRISGQAEFEGVPVTIDFVQRTLKDVIQGSDRPPTIEEILQAVSAYTGIKVVDMKGARRTQDIVRARHMAWWLCRDMTERSYPQIAQKFGGRDHTTCIAGKRRIDKQRETDAKLVGDLEAIIKILRKQ